MSSRRCVIIRINYGDPLGLEMVRGVADYAAEAGWELRSNTLMPAVRTHEELATTDLTGVDGIVGQVYGTDFLEALKRITPNVVNVSNRFADIPAVRVSPDDSAIGRLGAEHFLERGFGSMAFAGLTGHWYSDRRCHAFTERAREAGVNVHVYDDQPDINQPLRVWYERLARWIEDLPPNTALMAASDVRARHVLDAAEIIGKHVPDELAVLGVDLDEWTRVRTHVPLSSIDPAARRVGYEAARTLDGLMGGNPPPAEPVFIPPVGVIARRSTDAIAVDDPIVVQASQYIREHTARVLTVEEVVDAVGCSRRSLEMRFRKHLGRSPQEAIWRAHVDRARHLLEHTNLPAKAIAQRCGFGNAERLSVVFRRYTGQSPTGYRKQRVR
jgi:LacI family transcriptional regulator